MQPSEKAHRVTNGISMYIHLGHNNDGGDVMGMAMAMIMITIRGFPPSYRETFLSGKNIELMTFSQPASF